MDIRCLRVIAGGRPSFILCATDSAVLRVEIRPLDFPQSLLLQQPVYPDVFHGMPEALRHIVIFDARGQVSGAMIAGDNYRNGTRQDRSP